MNWSKIVKTIDENALDIIRIFIGFLLLSKGIQFLMHPEQIINLVAGNIILFWDSLIAHYIVLAHLVGGTLLMIGLSTRIAAAIQVPILSGAVFLIHMKDGLMGYTPSLEYAIIILILLIIFSITGSKTWSVDTYVKEHEIL